MAAQSQSEFRVIILTAGSPRHRYFVNRLAQAFPVVGVVTESKSTPAPKGESETGEDRELIQWWEELRDQAEKQFFGQEREFRLRETTKLIEIESGHINDLEVIEAVASWAPDVIAVYGTGLLKDTFISRFPGKLVNLHLGLSPYYRGSGTNLWPIVNGELEYIGATIHAIDPGIDTGAIIRQARPEITPDDDPHSIGAKCTILGTELMVKTLQDFASAPPQGVPQWMKGKLYQRKDWNVDCIRKIKAFMDSGGIREYAKVQIERSKRVSIIP